MLSGCIIGLEPTNRLEKYFNGWNNRSSDQNDNSPCSSEIVSKWASLCSPYTLYTCMPLSLAPTLVGFFSDTTTPWCCFSWPLTLSLGSLIAVNLFGFAFRLFCGAGIDGVSAGEFDAAWCKSPRRRHASLSKGQFVPEQELTELFSR